jgi:ribosomal protein L21E
MITPKFFATIEQGKVKHADPQAFQTYVIQKFKEGQEVEITIKRKFKKRTSGQPGEETNFNGYYWGVIVKIIADEIGEIDQDIVHEWLQIATGNTKIMPGGLKAPAGTAHMSGAEFADYCSRVRMWAGSPGNIVEKGIYLPEPYEAEYNL